MISQHQPSATAASDEQAIRNWLCAQLGGDRATADLLWDFAATHRDVVCCKHEVEAAHAMPHPTLDGGVSGTLDADRATAGAALNPSVDAQDLERLRKRAEARLRRTVHWYWKLLGEYFKGDGGGRTRTG